MEQLAKLIEGLSFKQKVSIVAAALLTVAGVVTFTRYRHEGDFRPLYTAMAPEDASSVVQKLRETGVEYRLSENGSSVMVPSAKLAESRLALAAAGLPKTGRIGFELFDKTSFGATEFVEHVNYKRALEGELERSVMSLAEVEQARVHLSLPKDSIFIEQQQPAKASVLIKLRPGAQLSRQNVLAVSHLVASAAQGLSPESVSILDMNGTLLSRPSRGRDDGSHVTSEALETRQQIERELVAKISTTLEPLIGPGKFRAGASVDFDLTSGEQQEETFDPSRTVMVSTQKTEDATESAASSGGIPGTASNLPNPASKPPAGGKGLSRRTENITFQASRVQRHTRIPQGIVKRMSLSVLLDQAVRWEGDGAARRRVLVPPTPETLKSIKELVAASTGLNAERGDQLIVEALPFESSQNAEPPAKPVPAPPASQKPRDSEWLQMAMKYRVWLMAALAGVLLLVGAASLMSRRRRRNSLPTSPPALAESPDRIDIPAALRGGAEPAPRAHLPASGEGASPIRIDLGEHVRQMARTDLSVTANVLRMWLHESKT